MSVARGMKQTGSRVGNMGGDNHQLEAVHKGDRLISAALDRERHYAAGAVGKVLLSKLVVFVALKARIMDPRDLVLRFEELSDFKRVFAVAVHSYMQAFKAVVEIERVHRRLN